MRKAGIMMSIVGAVAFAALLAWGLTFSSGTVRAQTPTATPTATPEGEEATPTATPAAFCAPTIPGTYNGSVTIDGQPAPVGTKITVSRGGVTFGETTVTEAGKYVVNVPEPLPSEPPCFEDTTGPLTFTCDTAVAQETPNFGSALQPLDLTCGAVPTPTATPPAATATPTATPPAATATPTATPPPATATPTPTPPTPGLGGTAGSGDSFMWWPLALAAAALTSVAGLFTTRWARR